MPDLSLVPTSDLVNEINSRHDSVIIAAVKHTDKSGNYVTYHNFSGSKFVCGWLVCLLQQALFQYSQEQLYPTKGDE
jgi:hypothetical protein